MVNEELKARGAEGWSILMARSTICTTPHHTPQLTNDRHSYTERVAERLVGVCETVDVDLCEKRREHQESSFLSS